MPLKKGVAHFALQAGVPIVPVALIGADRLRPFSRVTISVGTPIRPDPPAWWIPSRRVMEMVDRVRRAILRAFDRPAKNPEERLLAKLRVRLKTLTSRPGRSPS
jgi:1-acyl-sn-glycerol-3-phosphate acyltransferase